MEIQKLLEQANRELGQLDMYSEYIPNIDLFISMHVLKEATQSSKIEGTQTKIEEKLEISIFPSSTFFYRIQESRLRETAFLSLNFDSTNGDWNLI